MMAFSFLALTVWAGMAPQEGEKPSPVKILSCEFPLGDRYRPGRWFPLEILVESDIAWEGILWAQLVENGPIFERAIKLKEKERARVRLCALAGSGVQGVAVDTGASLAKFAGPLPSSSSMALLLGEFSDLDALRSQLLASPRLAAHREVWTNAVSASLAKLPENLYALDAFDWIAVTDAAARLLPPEAKELLLRWAVIRGRLLASEFGKAAMALDPARAGLVEIFDATKELSPARRFPLQHLPPQGFAPLQTRHFAQASDASFWILAIFGIGLMVSSWRRREGQSWAVPALLAGVAATLLAIPAISWPARTPPWRCLVLEEGQRAMLLEDRASGKSLPLDLDPRAQLLLPKPDHKFIAEWKEDASKANFFLLDHERSLFQAQFLDGRQIHRDGEGRLRNGLAPLTSLAFLLDESAQPRLLPSWSVGEALGEGQVLANEADLLSWPRPLRDFLTARWVSGNWLGARVAAQDPSPELTPFGGRPAACYLLWFPRVRD